MELDKSPPLAPFAQGGGGGAYNLIGALQKIWRTAREMRALRINDWSTHRPVRFILSYVLSVHYTAI